MGRLKPSQGEMEKNIMSGGLVNHNQNSRIDTLKKSKTGSGIGNDKKGGKKSIDVNKKMKKVMRKAGMIK